MRPPERTNYRVAKTPHGFTFVFDKRPEPDTTGAPPVTMFYKGEFALRKDAEHRMHTHETRGW